MAYIINYLKLFTLRIHMFFVGEPPSDEHFVETPGSAKSASTNLFLYQVNIAIDRQKYI